MVGRRVIGKLTAKQVQAAKQKAVLQDGGGLRLVISETGARSWSFRFSIDGRRYNRGLGAYPRISLAAAREHAARIRSAIAEGRHAEALSTFQTHSQPTKPQVTTFSDAFSDMFESKRAQLSNGKHAKQWPSTMETYVFPYIGNHPVADVSATDILKIMRQPIDDEPFWYSRSETARRVLQRIDAVLTAAILRGHRTTASPCAGVRDELGKARPKTTHHAAMPVEQVPNFITRLRQWPKVIPTTPLALQMIIFTATRSVEVRKAMWDEFDISTATWSVPAARMKARRDHRIPLSGQALHILAAAKEWKQNDLVFPSLSGKPLSDNTLSKLMRDAQVLGTPHGFRSTFKDWCEHNGVRDAVSEVALSHTDPNATRAAYRRTDYLEERQLLMQKWANAVTPAVIGQSQ